MEIFSLLQVEHGLLMHIWGRFSQLVNPLLPGIVGTPDRKRRNKITECTDMRAFRYQNQLYRNSLLGYSQRL